MSKDSGDILEDEEDENLDNMHVLMGKVLCNINFKVAVFLFAICVIIMSDIFIKMILAKIDGAVEGYCTTTKGALIQISSIVGGYLLVDALNTMDVI